MQISLENMFIAWGWSHSRDTHLQKLPMKMTLITMLESISIERTNSSFEGEFRIGTNPIDVIYHIPTANVSSIMSMLTRNGVFVCNMYACIYVKVRA